MLGTILLVLLVVVILIYLMKRGGGGGSGGSWSGGGDWGGGSSGGGSSDDGGSFGGGDFGGGGSSSDWRTKLIPTLAVLGIFIFPIQAFAWEPPVSPKPTSAISDPSGVLSDSDHSKLDKQLKNVNTSSANEIAVLILPTLDGEDISDVGIATAKAWGVGKKDLDNGVLIILAMKEHKSRIETGKGVEGDLPDLKANDILAKTLRPYMKKGDVAGGLSATIDAVSSSIADHRSQVNGQKTTHSASCQVSEPGSSLSFDLFLGFLFLVGFAFGWRFLGARREEDALTRKRQREEDEEERARAANSVKEEPKHDPFAAIPGPVPVTFPIASGSPIMKSSHNKPALKTSHLKHTTVAPAPVTTTAKIDLNPKFEDESTEAHKAEMRRLREHEEADRREREREEERAAAAVAALAAAAAIADSLTSSSSSSSSSDDDDDSSSGDSGSSGGDFGGGDFGGGGASSDW